jgi:hypothetical protein
MNQISPINIGPRPAYLPGDANALAINQAAFQNWQSGFGVLSLRGGKWHTRQGGNETTITASPGPGMAEIAVPMLPVVIVGVSTLSAKSYYAGGYNPNEVRPPDCFSIDGVEPDARATNKQAKVCITCPHNQWGSATNSPSGRGKACRDFKRVAVVRDLNDEPLMLQLPPTSVPNLQDYVARLARMQAAYNQVVTVMTFDNSKTAPTVTFTAQGWLDANQYARAAELGASAAVQRMLEQEWGESGSETEPAAANLGPRPAHLPPPPPAPAAAAAPPSAAAPAAPVMPPVMAPMKAVPLAPVPAIAAVAPTPPPAPTPAPEAPAPVVQVQGAPADMEQAIRALLDN